MKRVSKPSLNIQKSLIFCVIVELSNKLESLLLTCIYNLVWCLWVSQKSSLALIFFYRKKINAREGFW